MFRRHCFEAPHARPARRTRGRAKSSRPADALLVCVGEAGRLERLVGLRPSARVLVVPDLETALEVCRQHDAARLVVDLATVTRGRLRAGRNARKEPTPKRARPVRRRATSADPVPVMAP